MKLRLLSKIYRAGCQTRMYPKQSNDSRWFSSEVYSNDEQLRAYLCKAFPSLRDLEDIVQESYLRLWKYMTDQPIRSARSLLFTIARRVALNTIKRERASPIAFTGDFGLRQVFDGKPCARQMVLENETRQLLVEALASLPPRCREVTVMRMLKRLPQKDIASKLGIAEKTVEAQVNKGVRRCESFLKNKGIVCVSGL